MKKILTLAACAALCTSTLLADIKIGDTPYTSMSEAIKNIQTGEEIIISGTVSIDQAKLRNDNASIIIKGENNAELIIPANIGGIGFIIAK